MEEEEAEEKEKAREEPVERGATSRNWWARLPLGNGAKRDSGILNELALIPYPVV